MPLFRRIFGPLDSAALRRALEAVVDAQEVLRTSYSVEGGEAWQQVQPTGGATLMEFDVSGAPYPSRDRLAEAAILKAWDEDVVDFSSGRNIAAYLVRIGPEEHLLGTWINHVAGDGPSAIILLREWFAFYSHFAEGAESPSPLEYQYADYAIWENELRASCDAADADAWDAAYEAAEPLALASPSAGGATPSPVRSRTFACQDESWVRATDLAREFGSTSALVLMAIVGGALSACTGQERFCIGQIANMRPPGAERMLGSFSDTRPLAFDFRTETFAETLRRLRSAYAHGLDKRFRPSASLMNRLGLEQVSLNLMRERLTNGILETRTLSVRNAELSARLSPTTDAAVRVGLYDRVTFVTGAIAYAADRIGADQADRIVRCIRRGVTAFCQRELVTWRDVLVD